METYHVLAVVCLALAIVVFYLFRKNKNKTVINESTDSSKTKNEELIDRTSTPISKPTRQSTRDEKIIKEARELVEGLKEPKKMDIAADVENQQPDVESLEAAREKKKLYKELVETNFYCKSNVSLETCSKKLGISTRQLSARIKKHYNKSFLQFINDLRMERVVHLIRDKNITKVNDLMYMTGYKNRTTFNNLFKKKMNMTVTEFRESLKEGQEQ